MKVLLILFALLMSSSCCAVRTIQYDFKCTVERPISDSWIPYYAENDTINIK
jgi:hypothetical protein